MNGIKLLGLATATALFIGFLSTTTTATPGSRKVNPYYQIEKDGKVETVVVLCDDLVRTLARTQMEGQKRQSEALSCGKDTDPVCLPYYIQWSSLGELYVWLKRAVEDNCTSH